MPQTVLSCCALGCGGCVSTGVQGSSALGVLQGEFLFLLFPLVLGDVNVALSPVELHPVLWTLRC